MPERRQNPPIDFIDTPRHRSLRDFFFEFEFTLISCTYWRNTAPWHLPERTCPDSFLLIPLIGELRVFLGPKEYSITPGSFLMLAEGTPHVLNLKAGFKRLDQISIHCHIHDRWRRPLLARFPVSSGQLPDKRDFTQALNELACLMSHDPEIGRLYGETVLKELLVYQIRQGMILAPFSDADPRVGTVIQRMEKDLVSSDLSIEELALSVNITPVQLRKLFRKVTGTGPKQFLSGLRFKKAARLLRHTATAVKQVAVECGFASDHYFHLAFRQEFGCTPTEYRTKTAAEI